MFEIYQQLPNDTDFSIFKRAGLPGLNFAFIEGAVIYHTRLDDLEHFDLDTLQQEGSLALALTRHFGEMDLPGGAIPSSRLRGTSDDLPSALRLGSLIALGAVKWESHQGELP